MQAYDAQRFAPPAPVALVTCKNEDTGAVWVDMPMLIDTGADVSLLPQEVLKRLGLSVVPDRRYELVGFGGTVSTAPIVRAVVVFCGRSFRGQYLVVEQEYGILGRNLLNAVPLLLDGPRLSWAERG
jgi:hypothetical protein